MAWARHAHDSQELAVEGPERASRMRLPRKLRIRLRGLPRTASEAAVSLQLLGTLRAMGWHRSARERFPSDAAGHPIPWYSYGAISWLGPRLRRTDRVFEYGVGGSTLWYAQRVSMVEAVEHDQDWARRIASLAPPNANVRHVSSRDEYVPGPEGKGAFDIVVIDGEYRNECVRPAVSSVSHDGMIIFDNSNWPEHRRGLELLSREDFYRLDFEGFNPGLGTLFTTSMFFRDCRRWLDPETPIPDRGWESGGFG